MTQALIFAKDQNGVSAYAPPTATVKYRAKLLQNSESSITVPNDVDRWTAAFSFESGSTVWVDLTGATASLPSNSALATCTEELAPAARTVYAGGKISMITGDVSSEVNLVLYANPTT